MHVLEAQAQGCNSFYLFDFFFPLCQKGAKKKEKAH